jgi:Protein of unknown function (DUF1186)/SEC-C motif
MTTEAAETPQAARAAVMEELGLTPEAAPAVLEALSQMKTANAVQLGLAVTLYDHIAPALHAALAKFLETQELTDEEDNTLFWGVHIMAAARDRSAFPNMLRLLALPDDVLDPLLGDATTTTTGQLIAGTFDDDAAALIAFLERPDLDSYIRWNALETVAFLVFDKRIDPAEAEAFLHRFYTTRLLEPGDPSWYGWMVAAGLLGLTSLDTQVRAAFADQLIDPTMCGVDAWEALVAAAHAAPDDPARFDNEGVGYIDDIYESLSWVTWNDAENDEEEDDAAPPMQPVRNPLRNVGRNDPCPCGSGKKYKKCCLPA